MRFTNPVYLLLFVPVVVGLWASFSRVHGVAKTRKRLAFLIRFVLAGLLTLALAGPEMRRPNRGICTIFVVDRSDSVSSDDRYASEKFVNDSVSKLGPDDAAGVITFGKEPMVEIVAGGRRSIGKLTSQIDGSASDLAAAIRLASASFVDGKAKRIVILTDGNETNGDAIDAAQVAATDQISIDTFALGVRERVGEASVVSLDSPAEVRTDQPFELRAVLDSSIDQEATVTLDRDGVIVKSIDVKLTPGRNSVVLPEKITNSGFHKFRVTLRADHDQDVRNNVGLAYVNVRGKPKFLVLQQNLAHDDLARAMRRNGVAVDVVGAGGVPTRAEELQNYDGIFFNDFNAANLTVAQMKLIQSAVRDSGIGLAMVGGENSFLPGGYYGTPIAESLPVDLNIRQRKSFPSTSVAIIVDASGSMAMNEDGIPKLRLAGKAAEETIKMMSPMDRVALAGSADGVEWVLPMQELKDKAAAIGQCQRLAFGGGGIYIRPSMERAEQVLGNEPSKVRHLILMADGNDSDEQEGAVAIALRMRANKITTTVVAIGGGKDVSFLRTLAAAGGGRFCLADKASQLPAIVTQDAAIMSRSAIEEGRFFPKLTAGEEVLAGLDSVPALQAYCLVDSRPLARIGMRSQKDDPLLATWSYGLGTAMAFTSDAQARWAAEWVGWSGFDAFWSQSARVIARRATRNFYQTSVRYEGGKGLVEVKAFDSIGNPMTATNAKLRVSAPDGTSRELNLSQQAPGVYTSKFDANNIGTYIVTASEPDASGGMRTSAQGFSLPYPAEIRAYRTNRPVLQRIAETAVGRAISNPAESFRPVKDTGASISEIWPILVFVAALLLPFDVAVRRIALPFDEIMRKLWASFRRRPRVSEQRELVDRLATAKSRASTGRGEREVANLNRETQTDARTTPTAVPKAGGQTAKDLLEAKRRKKAGEK